jgi:carbamoyltransferase
MTAILGISAFYHDSAAALVVDGQIVAAAQEERFSRKKYDADFPLQSIDFCLQQAGLRPDELDYVGFYDKPLLKFERLLETYLAYAPAGFKSFLMAMPVWLRQKLHLPREMSRGLAHQYRKRFVFTEHHESHAASAFFPSPFEEAAVLTMDGVGEWATASWGVGRGNRIEIRQEQRFPHSLGLLYSAFTYYTGFTVNSGEYKLMGLAPYGEPKYVDLILERLIDLKADGSFRMDLSYFNYCQGLTMTSQKFHQLFGGPPRKPDSRLSRRDMDVAASIQKVTEEIMLRSARYVHEQTGLRKLCLAGGVALNCVANGRILREGPFDEIWIQPAAGDAGGALGAALFIWLQLLNQPRSPQATDSQRGSLLGPTFSDPQIKQFLDSVGATYRQIPDDSRLCEHVADRIAEGNVVGWFQGPLEFGPRALGSRSLLGDPRNPDMQTVMNVKVKFREGFRPFAPAVLAERSHEYFAMEPGTESPYMLLVAPVREENRRPLAAADRQREGIDKLKTLRSVVPAVTHVDYSARIQTVDRQRHGLYRGVLEAFYHKTGCPVLVNTSFNLGWEPIVCTPREAYRTFMSSEIDVLCLGHFLLTKAEQPAFASANREPAADAAAPMDEPTLPGYEDIDSLRGLIEKLRHDDFARQLDESIPYNTSVLVVGCGSGQLANFLGIACRRVTGTDIDPQALGAAEAFRSRHGLDRVDFVQMDPRKPCFAPGQFDVAICNLGRDTADPRATLACAQRLVRPGGYVVIGHRHKLALFASNVGIFAVDARSISGTKSTIREVQTWFSDAGLEFVRSVPSANFESGDPPPGALFEHQPPGSGWNRLLAQARELIAGKRRDGLFFMIGRKLSRAQPGTTNDEFPSESPAFPAAADAELRV